MKDATIAKSLQILSEIVKDIKRINLSLPSENRFDLASYSNNVHNVKVSGEMRYLDEFLSSYLGS
ncbi:MAG: hypothetical protein II721_06195, partial [Bacilli bacterium]|nr:hypothetical protein [Bacilli bacterium]